MEARMYVIRNTGTGFFLQKRPGDSRFYWVESLANARLFKRRGHAQNCINKSFHTFPDAAIAPVSVSIVEEEQIEYQEQQVPADDPGGPGRVPVAEVVCPEL